MATGAPASAGGSASSVPSTPRSVRPCPQFPLNPAAWQRLARPNSDARAVQTIESYAINPKPQVPLKQSALFGKEFQGKVLNKLCVKTQQHGTLSLWNINPPKPPQTLDIPKP